MAKLESSVLKEKFASGQKPTGDDFASLVDSCFQEVTASDVEQKADKTAITAKADKTYVDTELGKKANTGTLNAKANIADVYTKSEVDALINGLKEQIEALKTPTPEAGE